MKTLIISDIHGYKRNLEKVLKQVDDTFKYIIILGDLVTPGPDSKEIKELLNKYNYKIICMEGNNDYNISGLEFNVIPGYQMIKLDNNICYITHGNQFNERNNNFQEDNEILISGHTHIPRLEYKDNKYYVNPGSISLSRSMLDETYIIYENNIFYLYDIDNNLLNFIEIK